MAQPGLNGDESRQILILGSESIKKPGAHAGPLEREDSGVQLQHGRAVVHAVAYHGTHDAQVVSTGADTRE